MRRPDRLIPAILLAGLLLRLPLIARLGYPPDVAYWKSWLSYSAEFGLWNVYQLELPGQAYPPVIMFLLCGLGLLYRAIWPSAGDSAWLTAFVKLPSIAGDLAAAALLAALARRKEADGRLGPRGAAALLAFHPAAIWLSSFWGQADLLLGGIVVAGWWMILRRSPVAAGALLAIALLTKPQAMVVLPASAALLLGRCGAGGLLRAVGSGAVVASFLSLPFVLAGDGSALVRIYVGAGNVYPYLSLHAFNPWGVVGWLAGSPGELVRDDGALVAGIAPKSIGIALLLAASAWIAWRAFRIRENGRAWRLLTLQWFAFFLLPTQIHERYLVPALASFAAAVVHDRRWMAAFVVASAGIWLNLLVVAPGIPAIARIVEAVTLHGAIVAAGFIAIAILLLRAEIQEGSHEDR